MKLSKFLWIKGKQYRLYKVYPDCDYNELHKYCERQRHRNGTRYYIRTFKTQSGFWLPEIKHALYLNNTITLEKINTNYKKHPEEKRWIHTIWGKN